MVERLDLARRISLATDKGIPARSLPIVTCRHAGLPRDDHVPTALRLRCDGQEFHKGEHVHRVMFTTVFDGVKRDPGDAISWTDDSP